MHPDSTTSSSSTFVDPDDRHMAVWSTSPSNRPRTQRLPDHKLSTATALNHYLRHRRSCSLFLITDHHAPGVATNEPIVLKVVDRFFGDDTIDPYHPQHNGLSSLGGVTVEKGLKSCIDLLARSLGKSPKLTLRQAPQAASEAARRSPQLGTTASSAPAPGGNYVQCASIGSSVGLDPYSSSNK